MAEIISLADHGRRVLLRRFAQGAAVFALVPVVLAEHTEAAEQGVHIDNFTFSPISLTLPSGTIVKWVNQDGVPHSIYCAALNLHSLPLNTGDNFVSAHPPGASKGSNALRRSVDVTTWSAIQTPGDRAS